MGAAQAARRNVMSNVDHDTTAFDARGIGAQVVAGGRGFHLACREIEDRGMLGAFNRVFHDQSIAQMHIFVGAKAIGAEIGVFVVAVDCESAGIVIETDRILGIDIGSGTGVDPGLVFSLQIACGA